MYIIGVGHKARQGKNTVAKAIIQYCGAQGIYARDYGVCDALKAYCRVAFGMRSKDPAILQFVGTDAFRKFDPNIWIRVLFDTIDEQRPDVAIITDMRFPNEKAAIEERGGKTIHVQRLNADGTSWYSPDRDPLHSSETALNGAFFDYYITTSDLEEKARLAVVTFQGFLQEWQQGEVAISR